jgi:Zn ribbon nucleic-acid-binding protein
MGDAGTNESLLVESESRRLWRREEEQLRKCEDGGISQQGTRTENEVKVRMDEQSRTGEIERM